MDTTELHVFHPPAGATGKNCEGHEIGNGVMVQVGIQVLQVLRSRESSLFWHNVIRCNQGSIIPDCDPCVPGPQRRGRGGWGRGCAGVMVRGGCCGRGQKEEGRERTGGICKMRF